MTDFITLDTCPICAGQLVGKTYTAISNLFASEYALTFPTQRYVHYKTCEICGAVVQTPRMSGELIYRYYAEGIYRGAMNVKQEGIDRNEMERAVTDARLIARYAGAVATHLDIGCSRGYLLSRVNAPVQIGVEPNHDYVTSETIDGVYDTLALVPGKFQLITAIHSLEHEPSPLEQLQLMAGKLMPGGKIVIEVPTWKSNGGPLRLAHLYYWDEDAMRALAGLAGLAVVGVEYTPHMFAVMEAV